MLVIALKSETARSPPGGLWPPTVSAPLLSLTDPDSEIDGRQSSVASLSLISRAHVDQSPLRALLSDCSLQVLLSIRSSALTSEKLVLVPELSLSSSFSVTTASIQPFE